LSTALVGVFTNKKALKPPLPLLVFSPTRKPSNHHRPCWCFHQQENLKTTTALVGVFTKKKALKPPLPLLVFSPTRKLCNKFLRFN
jgi:hypothetical protein